jgi:hypothetical protein
VGKSRRKKRAKKTAEKKEEKSLYELHEQFLKMKTI